MDGYTSEVYLASLKVSPVNADHSRVVAGQVSPPPTFTGTPDSQEKVIVLTHRELQFMAKDIFYLRAILMRDGRQYYQHIVTAQNQIQDADRTGGHGCALHFSPLNKLVKVVPLSG